MFKRIVYKLLIGLPRKVYYYFLIFYRKYLLEKFPNLFRFSSKPYLTGDTLRSISDHILDDGKTINIKKIKNYDTIFVQSNYIDYYFENFSPNITKKHFLISHNHYFPITDKYLMNLNNNLVLWFAENLITSEPNSKLKAIPLGIENLKKFNNGIRSNFENKSVLKNQSNKEKLVLSSFAPHTNLEKRKEIAEISSKVNFIDVKLFPNHKTYVINLSKYKFNICPSGIGFDTHRYWESLLVKTIPIVITSNLINHYKDLGIPMLILSNWSEIYDFTEKELNKIYESKSKEFMNNSYLWINYWEGLIENEKINLKM
tara:strand:- start:12252 stop:13196 length:945 start_codon:yes stop_codon:yes gene_type:complete